MMLSDAACRRAAPKAKPYRISDGQGLYLNIMPKGAKYWVFRYRFAGKENNISFGVYPATGLAAARVARDAARKLLSDGIDPAIAKIKRRLSSETAQGTDFETIGREWIEKQKSALTPRYASQIEARLVADIFPVIGRLPIGEIKAPHVLQALKKVGARDAVETMHRLKQYCSQIFRFAIARGQLEHDPVANLRGALPSVRGGNYAAIAPDELPALLAALKSEKNGVGLQTRLALRMMLLTFVRTSELTGARWDEIDLEKAIWIIPAARMKMKRDHLVPLARQTVELLNALRMIGRGVFVFPGRHGHAKPISNMTLLMGLKRMGYKGRMTGHGFRALAMTTLREVLEVDYHLIDLQLAHAPANKIKAAYDRAKFIKQRTEMMQRWADYVDEVEASSVRGAETNDEH